MSDVKGQEEFSWSPEAAKAPSSSGADLNFDAMDMMNGDPMENQSKMMRQWNRIKRIRGYHK